MGDRRAMVGAFPGIAGHVLAEWDPHRFLRSHFRARPAHVARTRTGRTRTARYRAPVWFGAIDTREPDEPRDRGRLRPDDADPGRGNLRRRRDWRRPGRSRRSGIRVVGGLAHRSG